MSESMADCRSRIEAIEARLAGRIEGGPGDFVDQIDSQLKAHWQETRDLARQAKFAHTRLDALDATIASLQTCVSHLKTRLAEAAAEQPEASETETTRSSHDSVDESVVIRWAVDVRKRGSEGDWERWGIEYWERERAVEEWRWCGKMEAFQARLVRITRTEVVEVEPCT